MQKIVKETIIKNNPPSNDEQTDKQKQPKALPDKLPSDGFTRLPHLAQRLGVHPQTIRRWWKNGNFPKPKHINGVLLFINSEVKEWIAQQGGNA